MEVSIAFATWQWSRVWTSLYLRVRIRLLSPDVEVWTYLYNKDVTGRPVVESGHWLQYKRDTNKAEDYPGT